MGAAGRRLLPAVPAGPRDGAAQRAAAALTPEAEGDGGRKRRAARGGRRRRRRERRHRLGTSTGGAARSRRGPCTGAEGVEPHAAPGASCGPDPPGRGGRGAAEGGEERPRRRPVPARRAHDPPRRAASAGRCGHRGRAPVPGRPAPLLRSRRRPAAPPCGPPLPAPAAITVRAAPRASSLRRGAGSAGEGRGCAGSPAAERDRERDRDPDGARAARGLLLVDNGHCLPSRPVHPQGPLPPHPCRRRLEDDT